MPVHRTLNQDFFKTWSPDMAYVLGYFAADGCMIANKRGGHYIEITTTDRILLEKVRAVTVSKNRIGVRQERKKNWKTQYRLQISSQTWFKDLIKLGFTNAKSKTLKFPAVPEPLLGDFIRGYFDGDGCVYLGYLKYADRKNKRWVVQTLFTSGSREFLIELWNLLKERGVRGGSLVSKNRGFELKFSHKDSVELYRLMYHNARTQDIYLPRKRQKLKRAVEIMGKLRE